MEIAALAPTSATADETPLQILSGNDFFQPHRLDVLVHLLALERLAGVSRCGEHPDEDWVAYSDGFAAQDNERSTASLAAELFTSPDADLVVTFSSGGHLARGAGAAAASIYSGRPAMRVDGNDKMVDRSIDALKRSGWSLIACRSLLQAWALRDTAATVVLVDLDCPDAPEVEHELQCRFAVFYREIEHLSLEDARAIGSDRGGSTALYCVRSSPELMGKVLDRHANAIPSVSTRHHAGRVLSCLWAQDRTPSSSASHDQLLRRVRRQALRNQLLELARRR